jgi:hypothetical protein
MMISLIRIALIMLIIYLIQRAFSGKNSAEGRKEKTIKINNISGNIKTKVSKEIGEYVEYEEVKK